MNIEFIWLAYDENAVNKAWKEMTIRELYFLILKDEFRRKVDFRTTLFHRSQFYLIDSIERLLKIGAGDITLTEYKAYLFKNEEENFPLAIDELFFDFQIISYFTTFRMSDDYALIEKLMTIVLYHLGILEKGEIWNIFTFNKMENFIEVFNALDSDRIIELAEDFAHDDTDFVRNLLVLIGNYIEFFNYAKNNKFKTFYYNNFTDIKYWGDLVERKNLRNEEVVKISFRPIKEKKIHVQKTRKVEDKVEKTTKNLIKKRQNAQAIIKNLVSEPDPMIKLKSTEILGTLMDKGAIPVLVELLKEEEGDIRQESIRALNSFREKSIEKYFIEALHDESSNVVISAALSLMASANPLFVSHMIDAFLRGVLQLSPILASILEDYPESFASEVGKLINLQELNNPVLKREVAFIVGQTGKRELLDILLANFDSDDYELKLYSCAAILKISGKAGLRKIRAKNVKMHTLKTVFASEMIRREMMYDR